MIEFIKNLFKHHEVVTENYIISLLDTADEDMKIVNTIINILY